MPDDATQFAVTIGYRYWRSDRKIIVDQNAHAAERKVFHVAELVELADSVVPTNHHEIASSDSRLRPAFSHRVFIREVQPRNGGSQSDESARADESARDMFGDA
jgi:hypothetical protein